MIRLIRYSLRPTLVKPATPDKPAASKNTAAKGISEAKKSERKQAQAILAEVVVGQRDLSLGGKTRSPRAKG